MKQSYAPYCDHATHWKCSSIPNLVNGHRFSQKAQWLLIPLKALWEEVKDESTEDPDGWLSGKVEIYPAGVLG